MKTLILSLTLFYTHFDVVGQTDELIGRYEGMVQSDSMYGYALKNTASLQIVLELREDSTYTVQFIPEYNGECEFYDTISINHGKWTSRYNFIFFSIQYEEDTTECYCTFDPMELMSQYGFFEYTKREKRVVEKTMSPKDDLDIWYEYVLKMNDLGEICFDVTADCYEYTWQRSCISRKP